MIRKEHRTLTIIFQMWNYDGKNFFDQTVKGNKVTYGNVRKNSTGQRDEYKTGC